MPSDHLDIRYGDHVAATIHRDDAQQLHIQYAADIATGLVRVPPLSLSLPFQTAAFAPALSRAFLDGLLPEGTVRDTLERRHGIPAGDTFSLLSLIGRDCAGAFTIVPPGDDRTTQPDGVRWLSESELAEGIAALPQQPLAVDPDAGVRLSLGGAQNKMAVVVREDSAIGLPRGAVPSTHILKPAILARDERRGRHPFELLYPESVQNEALCMRLAADAGIPTANIVVRRVADDLVLLVERYDRQRQGGRVIRLHQEDFCQVLGVHPNQKFDRNVAPSFEQMASIVRHHSSRVAADLDHLVDLMGFNYLIGNSDAHGKNFAILYALAGLRLAPAYDLLATRVYPAHRVPMAMFINLMDDPRGLQPLHWATQLDRMELRGRTYRERLADLVDRVTTATPRVTAWADEVGILSPLTDNILSGIAERAPILAAVRTVDVPRRRSKSPIVGRSFGD